MNTDDPLSKIWNKGFSISDLWNGDGARKVTSDIDAEQRPWPDMFAIMEYEEGPGAGERYLRERLRGGDWIAIGYRAPRSPRSRLELVPFVDDPVYGYTHSSITGDGLSYVGVRIVSSRLLSSAAIAVQQKRPGRPSSREVILAAYERVKVQGSLRAGSSISNWVRAVQAVIVADRAGLPDPLRGFQKEAIAKILRELRDSHKL
jgi:hypothetical protein